MERFPIDNEYIFTKLQDILKIIYYTNLFFVSPMGYANRGDRVELLENEIIKVNKVTIKCLVF